MSNEPDDLSACPDCGGYGEYYGHADDCDNDDCALAGGMDDCNGQVFPCHCAASLPINEEDIGV